MTFVQRLMFVTADLILLLHVDTHQSLVAGQSGGYPEYAAHAVYWDHQLLWAAPPGHSHEAPAAKTI